MTFAVAVSCSCLLAQSMPGRHATSQLTFRTLKDSKRSDRNVPMKVHLPEGRGPFPVVIVSHGAGGNVDSNFAQANHLATHGYIVVCVEHVGSNTKKMLSGGFRVGQAMVDMTRNAEEVLGRPRDIHFAIDQMEKWNRTHSKLKGRFDHRRIGMMGHSFGAFTTLTVSGARPALDWLKPQVGSGKGLGPDLSDKRVVCAVALSPQGPGEPFFLPTSYSSIRVPLLGITGSRDKQQGAEPIHRKNSFQYWPKRDRYLLWINNANHLQFSDSTGSKLKRSKLTDKLGQRREDVQKVSRAATLMFFDRYLKKTSGADLDAAELKKHIGGIVDGIELLSK